jgi:hypothetical protein
MRRVTLVAILLALAISASVNQISARPAAQSGNDLLQLLPDGNAVIVIDMQKMTTSSLWGAISSQEKIKSNIDKANSELSDLGIKLGDLQTVALTFPAADMNSPVIAVTGGFEQNDLLTRLRANAKIKLTSEKYKNFDIYRVESVPAAAKDQAKESKPAPSDGNVKLTAKTNDDGSFAFYDAKTVVVGSPASVRASIDTKTGARTSIAQNAQLNEGLAQNPAAAIRFALNVTPAMTSGIQSSQIPLPDFSSVKMIFGSVDVASGLDLIATLRSDTAEHAKNIADRLNGLLEMVRGYVSTMSNDPKMAGIAGALKTVSVTGSDIDVKISGNLPLEIFTQIMK